MAFACRDISGAVRVSKYTERVRGFWFGSERGIDDVFVEWLLLSGIQDLYIYDATWTREGEKMFLELLPESGLQSLAWTKVGNACVGDVVRALPRTTIKDVFIHTACVNDSDVQAFGAVKLPTVCFYRCQFAAGVAAGIAAANSEVANLLFIGCRLGQREFEMLCDVLGSGSHASLCKLDLTNNEITDFSPLERVVKANPLRTIFLENNNIASLANIHILTEVDSVRLPRARNPRSAFLQLMDHLYGGPAMFTLDIRILYGIELSHLQSNAIGARIAFIHSKRVKRMLAFCAGKTRHGATVPNRLPMELIRMVAEFACDWRSPTEDT